MRSLLPRLGRASALLLLALWAVEPVATWVHYGDHTHLYCATHQTFEEGRRSEGSAVVVGVEPAAPLAQLVRALPAAQEQAPRTHEACSLPGCGARQVALPGPAPSLSLAPALQRGEAAPPRLAPPPPLSALDTAPKASPPSRA